MERRELCDPGISRVKPSMMTKAMAIKMAIDVTRRWCQGEPGTMVSERRSMSQQEVRRCQREEIKRLI